MSMLDEALRAWIREAIRVEFENLPEQLAKVIGDANREHSAGLPVYLTAEEVAELAKVRPQTVRTWVSSKVLPGHYAGRKLRIRLDELEDFMKRQRAGAEPSADDDEKRVREIMAMSR